MQVISAMQSDNQTPTSIAIVSANGRTSSNINGILKITLRKYYRRAAGGQSSLHVHDLPGSERFTLIGALDPSSQQFHREMQLLPTFQSLRHGNTGIQYSAKLQRV